MVPTTLMPGRRYSGVAMAWKMTWVESLFTNVMGVLRRQACMAYRDQ